MTEERKKQSRKQRRQQRSLGWGIEKILDRSRRDGSKVVRISVYPTEQECVGWRLAAKTYGFASLSELVTEAVNQLSTPNVPFIIKLPGDLAKKAEVMARDAGFENAEQWFIESLSESIKESWGERTSIIPPDVQR